jgi:LuxR family maltose regulon positive regulatory protein
LPDGSTTIAPWLALVRAKRCQGTLAQMQADATLSLEGIALTSPLQPTALLTVGFSHLLAGDDETADGYFARAVEAAAASSVNDAGCVALAERALLALGRSRFAEAEEFVRQALALAEAANLGDYVTTTIVMAASARIAIHGGDSATARANLTTAQRLRPQLTHALPWFATQTLLELVRANLALAEFEGARALLGEAEEIIRLRPGLGVLAEQARELRRRVARTAEPEGRWASTLTTAELRLLPLLTTHLSFREIADRLHVSRNTVKAQAISIYRKLGVSSRSEAITKAGELGLVDTPALTA